MIPFPFQSCQAGRSFPPASGATPHRYWRLYITAGSSNFTSIKELEFAQLGGADLCAGGAAIKSTEYGGLPASNAFDNDLTTVWAPDGSALPQWIGYDFGAGNAKDIQVVRLLQRDSGQYPSAFNVQYSDDGSSWTTAWSVSGLDYQDALRPFPDPVLSVAGKTLARLRVTAADGHAAFTTGDLNFYESGVDVTGNGKYFSGTAITDLANAFDADTATFAWGNTTAIMGVEFSSARNITGFSTTCRNLTTQALRDGVLEASSDGMTWTALKTVTGETAWSLGETRTYTV